MTSHTLIAVATCHGKKFVERAQAQRDTWVGRVHTDVDVKFFAGYLHEHQGQEFTVPYAPEFDGMVLPVSDSYECLPEKVRAICRYAMAQGYDRLLKCDDDVYIVPEHLLIQHAGREQDYVGATREAHGIRYNSGFAYWLSKRAIEIIAHAQITSDTSEDRWVGTILAHYGIQPTRDPNFLYIQKHSDNLGNCDFVWGAQSRIGYGAVFSEFTAAGIRRMHKNFHRWYEHPLGYPFQVRRRK